MTNVRTFLIDYAPAIGMVIYALLIVLASRWDYRRTRRWPQRRAALKPSAAKELADELARRRALRAVRQPLTAPQREAVERCPTRARGRYTPPAATR